MNEIVKIGRPKTLTYEQREINRKRASANYKKNNREKYNKQMRNYNLVNKEKLKKKASDKLITNRKIKDDPFYNNDNPLITDRQKQSLTRMSELVSIFCKQKKTKGYNYQVITFKRKHMEIMINCGFDDIEDIWVSNSWHKIPMLILGWNDILKLNENKLCDTTYKMSLYGYLRWKINIPKGICKIIIDYIF
jgi:hypothetical protein